MNRKGSLLLALALGFAGALGGAMVGRMMPHGAQDETALHQLLHDELALDASQQARINAMNAGFAAQKAQLVAQQRAANAELAAALRDEHSYGPRVAAAVDRSHHAMGALQKATLEHVFAMRAVLRPDQAARFDAGVARMLTATEADQPR
ncbi:periplasmic heavy metal sensor [Novosphingobium sp. KACC 22771]|uniref:periplasmic heavy metal sensor n=1 Tax=Novosphingobium sp. KACC 22771 TaxID=3025670 RepID=UPI002365672F|nr:periplasmic heavy metal sensor [Novosphingobium sp. KACC 22771]WDF71505.1 periplasmic heavy metal sensor [Novosphingobium sp. KACC 22771]